MEINCISESPVSAPVLLLEYVGFVCSSASEEPWEDLETVVVSPEAPLLQLASPVCDLM